MGTLTTASQTNITAVGTLGSLAVTGNITSGNVSGTRVSGTNGDFTNVTGNGSALTALNATNIASGTLAQARLANASLTVNGTSIALGGSATVTATATGTLTIGSGLGGTSYNGSTGVTITNTGVTSIVAGTNIAVSGATGAVTVSVTGTVASATSATTAGTVTTAAQGNITSVGTLTSLAVSGAITVNSSNGVTAIVNGGTNGVGNIGSAATTFNTVFAKATTAQYADLAENYAADDEYEPGTVVEFGGDAEVTMSNEFGSTRIAGVVSTEPAYLMNSHLEAEYVTAVALMGRVPVKVTGPVRKGDMMISDGHGRAKSAVRPEMGSVIGKALENFDGAYGVIEVVIGKM